MLYHVTLTKSELEDVILGLSLVFRDCKENCADLVFPGDEETMESFHNVLETGALLGKMMELYDCAQET